MSYDRSDYNSCMEHVLKHENPQIQKTQFGVTISFEADTGTWYGVHVSPLANVGGRFGGQTLISVLSPWNTAYPFNPFPGEQVHPSYIAEKLIPRDNPAPIDLAALTRAIQLALNSFFGV